MLGFERVDVSAFALRRQRRVLVEYPPLKLTDGDAGVYPELLDKANTQIFEVVRVDALIGEAQAITIGRRVDGFGTKGSPQSRDVVLHGVDRSCRGVVSAGAAPPPPAADVRLLASGLQGTIGATIGPDGALYVAEGAIEQITRIDLNNGSATPFATGLPSRFPGLPLGGVMDVAFQKNKAYALVSVTPSKSGIYEVVNGTVGAEPLADLGQFSVENPPCDRGFDYFVPTGVQFAMQPIPGGFLVSDGHHNRILHATLNGDVSEEIGLENVVPTGVETRGSTVYVSEVGPVPVAGQPLPAGRVVAYNRHPTATLMLHTPRVAPLVSHVTQ